MFKYTPFDLECVTLQISDFTLTTLLQYYFKNCMKENSKWVL